MYRWVNLCMFYYQMIPRRGVFGIEIQPRNHHLTALTPVSFAPNKFNYEERYNSDTGELFCGFYEEGTFNNVDLNDCIFGTIYYFVVEEDSDTLTMRSIQSDGAPEEGSSTPCDGGVATLSFQIIDENLMEITITFTQAGIEESETLYALRSDNSFSTNDCVNQPLNGNTFW